MWQLLWCVTAACAPGQTESNGVAYATQAQCEQEVKRLFVGDRAFCVRVDAGVGRVQERSNPRAPCSAPPCQ
jgi:hypothetical protein